MVGRIQSTMSVSSAIELLREKRSKLMNLYQHYVLREVEATDRKHEHALPGIRAKKESVQYVIAETDNIIMQLYKLRDDDDSLYSR